MAKMTSFQDVVINGYMCNFKFTIPEDSLCKKCRHVPREPNLISCCGDHFCKDCIAPYQLNKLPCPSCGEVGFSMMLDKREHKKILSLKVYCSMRSRGCKWIGELKGLEAHMDMETGDCMHITVQCPSDCGQEIERGTVKDHLAHECPLRDYTCPHCNFKASYKVVSEDHWPECPYYPVQCPNKCGAHCERDTLKDHINVCSKEGLVCSFSYAGCREKFLREDMEKHMEKATKKHLSLLAATIFKMSEKLQNLEKAFDECKQENDRQLAELQYNTGHSHQVPVTFTMPYFDQLRQTDVFWYSSSIYTHLAGYNILIVVAPNGIPQSESHGSYVCVLIKPKPGDYDKKLKWPMTLSLTVQLLNQHADKNHITKTAIVKYGREKMFSSDLLVVDDFFKFVSLKELGWNADKETQYLKNDTLQFKVVKIVTNNP